MQLISKQITHPYICNGLGYLVWQLSRAMLFQWGLANQKSAVMPLSAATSNVWRTLCPSQPDMRSGLRRTASASRTKIQNVCSGFTLVSQSVSCCHAVKCSLVFSKDLLTKCIVFCANNLSGYLTHVVEWTGVIWPSSSFWSAVVVPIILLAEKLDSCGMNRGVYLLTLTLCPV